MILNENALCKANKQKHKICAINTKTEVKPRFLVVLVETTGIEPVTPCMSSKYSNQLSYASISQRMIL